MVRSYVIVGEIKLVFSMGRLFGIIMEQRSVKQTVRYLEIVMAKRWLNLMEVTFAIRVGGG